MIDILRGLIALPLLFVYGLLTIPMTILDVVLNFLIGDIEL